ncbi:MAG: NYN domain-containing protein [Polyangiales bacterium]
MRHGHYGLRIGLFIDGGFFRIVSDYYAYHHERRKRLNISGVREFVLRQVAESEGLDVKTCHIVSSQYFQGRSRARDAEERGSLVGARKFEDALIRADVQPRYLPLGPEGEKGVDVWLALEAYELALLDHMDVCVLLAGDGDFLPLVRKLKSRGMRVLLLAWDFHFTDAEQRQRQTRTSQSLLDEANYAIEMHRVIDDRSRRGDGLVNNLFLQRKPEAAPREAPPAAPAGRNAGTIKAMRDGFGFIVPTPPAPDIFFHHTGLSGVDYNDLAVGMNVTYVISANARGLVAIDVEVQHEPPAPD